MTTRYLVTASAIGSYFYTYVEAETAAEAMLLAEKSDNWDFELGEPELDDTEIDAVKAGRLVNNDYR